MRAAVTKASASWLHTPSAVLLTRQKSYRLLLADNSNSGCKFGVPMPTSARYLPTAGEFSHPAGDRKVY